jgi:hypothetical protein
MSIGSSFGIIASLATSGYAQRTADVERLERDTSDQSRVADSNAKAEKAAGIGEPEEEAPIEDRDADGRQPWELSDHREGASAVATPPETEPVTAKDPHGESGNLLDVSG